MYTIKVNEEFEYKIENQQGLISVNGDPVALDIEPLIGGKFNVLYDNKSYNVELVDTDPSTKKQTIKVNGTLYHLDVNDQYDDLLKQLGMDTAMVTKVHEIKAPMPGLVLKVIAAAGDEVKKGDNLIVLEAMKMENMIKSPADGKIKHIPVVQGDKIEKNAVLIQFH